MYTSIFVRYVRRKRKKLLVEQVHSKNCFPCFLSCLLFSGLLAPPLYFSLQHSHCITTVQALIIFLLHMLHYKLTCFIIILYRCYTITREKGDFFCSFVFAYTVGILQRFPCSWQNNLQRNSKRFFFFVGWQIDGKRSTICCHVRGLVVLSNKKVAGLLHKYKLTYKKS